MQSARVKESVMVEVGPFSEENNLPTAEPQARHDFSGVQGFQVIEGHSGPQTGSDQAWRDALRLELEVRAARLHQAVDTAIVLSNDGVIRWLGDPVARLSPGSDVLNPSAVILAHESLSAEARQTIKTRIELWIAATTRRVLAPLFALEALQEASEIVRDLARELVRSLGVLEREPIRSKIKALAQDDRAELRKQGVRFGAYYIFLPATIKPAPRSLALQLWGLQAPGDADELVRALAPVASSGRTSLPSDKAILKEGYRVAGYRPCGERIVRVDVVERLAGMIRAAMGGEAPEPATRRPNHRTTKGFVVRGEMTSLTGCSGDQFASILRSMGFRPVEMRRSDFFAPPSPDKSPGQAESVASAEHQGQIADNQTSTLASAEGSTPDAILATPPSEPMPDLVADAADAVPEDADAVADAADAVAEDAEAVAEDGEAVPADTAAPLVSGEPSDDSSEARANVEAASAQASQSGCESTKDAEVIVVWRPERRRTSSKHERDRKQPGSAVPARLDPHGHSPAPTGKRPPNAGTDLPAARNRPDPAHANEKRRQRPNDYGMARANPTTAPQHQAKVDPNSPFAKLLELRPLLEEQANKRP